ncbi:MAG: 4-(cytidine 5'-diphospho)-2-C-methyl-D-erythritol kinase [SAR324 cluster bacterium]|nr:4-(cytidine 5'-diphospho)-2-C-methyl-D-erythritol kinase [SAR324 cluster bacterium]MBL7034671.1 4-(cytidine 5'-diphospho)-2-C-methyl-D-erythritol kinase [SAR324 cluster bacterium]
MIIQTPAKINPLLYILNKRKDAFHEVYMHMLPVSLFDRITFCKNDGQGLNFRILGADFSEPTEDNLVVRAVRSFEQVSGITVNFDILLEKNIPSGAGLGGGSGNAAGTIQALNYLFRKSPEKVGLLAEKNIQSIAAELGSDVPFFLNPIPAEISGRGEKTKPLNSYPKLFLIVIKPQLSISTKEAYQKCNPENQNKFPKIHSLTDLKNHLHNQFESSLLTQFPVLSELKSRLLNYGAFGALVSGSGSAVFGIYKDNIQQLQAFKDLSCLANNETFICESLDSYQYF